ncbi:glutathione S-transferase family protein [Sneathiella chinensis]|uniref:Glutathione S-transferase n=1 Tax=Sneathiella chinensis TaxID=349750 RepID=A0ABQ5U5B3_9PROT|nr:glutathione S-transferase [Sneathiella chinensis]GLQ06913.1 glutathione S-transferase [Sneathiella chinensis]
MIRVHHLQDSRSQRILWLLEELGLTYEVVRYERDATTRLAPEALKKIHPLGKSPVLEDGAVVIHESGAIVDYLIRTYGNGRLAPAVATPDYNRYVEWIHYAEGSAMTPMLLRLYASRLGEAAEPLMPRINSETANHFGYMAAALGDRDYFVGEDLTGADIMLSFPLEAANANRALDRFPNLAGFVARIQTRPAYVRALEKGGDYAFGPR